jgi:hypothetical protein
MRYRLATLLALECQEREKRRVVKVSVVTSWLTRARMARVSLEKLRWRIVTARASGKREKKEGGW